jgi:N-acetylmuramoyl-L-alanine amidase
MTFIHSRPARVVFGVVLLGLAVAGAPSITAQTGDPAGCTSPAATATTPWNNKTVVLDPGHGAGDSGAINEEYDSTRPNVNEPQEPTLYERDLVLEISNRTSQLLVGRGYRVCLTRTDNSTNPSNTDRGLYANSVKGNVLVLVHLNGASSPTTNYTKNFWGKKSKDLKFSEAINKALVADSAFMNPDGVGGNDVTNGGVGQFASGALLKANMPATLAELVFLTSDAEALRLERAKVAFDRKQQLAAALGNAIDSWLKSNP